MEKWKIRRLTIRDLMMNTSPMSMTSNKMTLILIRWSRKSETYLFKRLHIMMNLEFRVMTLLKRTLTHRERIRVKSTSFEMASTEPKT